MKECNKCKITKELSEFYSQKTGKQGVFATCKECMREHARGKYKENGDKEREKQNLYRRNNPVAARMRTLKCRYGITAEEYNNLNEKQKGNCAICGRNHSELGRMLDVDHCHETGKIRGLLCNNCNQGIGLLKDNPDILRNAIKYLTQ